MSKWVSGILMTLNGLGAVEAVNFSLQRHDARLAGLLFTLGLALAFLGAVVMHQIARRMDNAGLEMYNYTVNADFSGDSDEERKAMLEARMKHASRFAYVPAVMAGTSLLLFIVAVVLMEMS